MSLQSKVALVTGGTSGIGKEAVFALAKAGAKVVVAGRRQAEGDAVVAEVKQSGGEAFFVQTDVAKEADVKRLVNETVQKYGRLDIAFNNAGVEHSGPLVEATEEQYRHVFDINVAGVIYSMKYEIPAMLKSGGGSIINTSSVLGHVGGAGSGLYNASKFAVEGLTKTAALELATQGVRVNAVAPAAIQTDMITRFVGGPGSDGHNYLTSLHPIGRLGKTSEIVGAVLFLASDAASFITGISLPVDGGFLAK